MDYQINIGRPFKYRHRKRGLLIFAPGVYQVPEEIEKWAAELAISQQSATKIDLPWTKPPMKFQKRANRRKKPAPENKLLVATENKT